MFRPDKKLRFTIGGGLGMAFASIDGQVTDGKTTLTFNDYTDDEVDREITLGVGFVFGN